MPRAPVPSGQAHDREPWGAGPWATGEPGSFRGSSPTVRLWLPVALSALVQVPASVGMLRLAHSEPGVVAFTVALAALGPLALIAARRMPGPVVAVTGAAALALFLFGVNGGPPPLAFAFALAAAVVRGARVWAWCALALAWSAALVAAFVIPVALWNPPRLVLTTLGLVLATGIGEAVRERRGRIRAYREEARRRRLTAAEEERMRIARELHDVLAHSLSQINVQAGVGVHLAETQPEKAVEALTSIKSASKTALDEVRAVLGVLRSDGETAPRAPQAGVADIRELVTAIELPGADVALVDELDGREVPAAIGSAAYRIVQEALTNVVRHGDGVTRVLVRLADAGDRMLVEIRDDGAPVAIEPGRGLIGMRERAELLGGGFTAASDDGFVVRAELPWTERT